jgi:hypothetical protein
MVRRFDQTGQYADENNHNQESTSMPLENQGSPESASDSSAAQSSNEARTLLNKLLGRSNTPDEEIIPDPRGGFIALPKVSKDAMYARSNFLQAKTPTQADVWRAKWHQSLQRVLDIHEPTESF